MKRYELEGCAAEVAAPVEVGRAPGHHWFSTLHPFGEGRLVCEVVLADDKAQGQWPATLYLSDDDGATWRRGLDIPSYGAISTPLAADERLLMPYEQWPLAPGDKRNATAPGTILKWGGDEITATPAPVKFLGFPRDLAPYREDGLNIVTNGNILPPQDGRLLTTMYGTFEGDDRYSLPAMTSDDGGFTWRFLSLVADFSMTPGAPEGPCESHTARLADGRLLCVYRVGSGRDYPYFKSLSADEGLTWTAAEPVAGAWSVEPQLVRLENGLLALSGGRWGLFLWVCTDGEGRAWQRVNLAEHHNAFTDDPGLRYDADTCRAEAAPQRHQTTSYTGMIATGPDEVMISYDRLANDWHGGSKEAGELDAVFVVRARITSER